MVIGGGRWQGADWLGWVGDSGEPGEFGTAETSGGLSAPAPADAVESGELDVAVIAAPEGWP